MSEVWKKIPDMEYDASNLGRIRASTSQVVISQRKTDKGYRVVTIGLKNKRTSKRVHRLVLAAFIGPSTSEINHKDADKSNNRLENLEYCTRQENMSHAKSKGLTRALKGDTNPNSKLNEFQVMTIITYLNAGTHTHVELGKMFEVHSSTIGHISLGRLWPHMKGLRDGTRSGRKSTFPRQ